MHIDSGTALKVFFWLGGTGLVLGAIAKGVKPTIKRAAEWAIGKDHPEVRAFALKHRVWFEAQFAAADQAVNEALDEAAALEAGGDQPPA